MAAMTDAPDPELRFLDAVERLRAKTGSPEKGAPLNNLGITVADIPLVCACGKRWTGPAFTPLKQGETERQRTCSACLDAAEARLTAKHAQEYPKNERQGVATTHRDAAPLRVPFKDD